MMTSQEIKESVENEKMERRLSELQNNIHHIERKIRLTDTEKKADTEENHLKIKKNDLEIQQLRMQIKELQVRMERCQKADENVISKAFRKCSRESGPFKGKSAKEAIQLLDSEVFDVQRKCKSLEHELQLKKRTQLHNEQQYRDMVSNCNADFENEPTEFHSMQHIRELENEQQKVNKNITECEIAEGRFKRMKEQLKKNRLSYVKQVIDVQKEYDAQVESSATDSTEPSTKMKDSTTTQLEASDEDPNKKKVRFSPQKNFYPPDQPSEQEAEYIKIKETFDRIKEVTGVSDIQEVESRFIEQKSIQEDLSDLKRRFSKSLHDLKTEKKQLDSRMEFLREANSGCPKRELEDELRMSKIREEEQEKRKKMAKIELDKIDALVTKVDAKLLKIMNLLQKSQSAPMISPPEEGMTITKLSLKLEEQLKRNVKK